MMFETKIDKSEDSSLNDREHFFAGQNLFRDSFDQLRPPLDTPKEAEPNSNDFLKFNNPFAPSSENNHVGMPGQKHHPSSEKNQTGMHEEHERHSRPFEPKKEH